MSPDDALDVAGRWLAARLQGLAMDLDSGFQSSPKSYSKRRQEYSQAEEEARAELQRLGLIRRVPGRGK